MKQLIPLIAACLLCISCDGLIGLSAFTKDSEIRLVVNGQELFVYDEASCQLGFNRGNCEFRVHNDNMSEYFVITLDKVPTQEAADVSATIRYSTDDTEVVKNNVALNVEKVEGDRIWLWNNPSKTGAVVRVLEAD